MSICSRECRYNSKVHKTACGDNTLYIFRHMAYNSRTVMKDKKTVYYTDEQNDEFSSAKITPGKIDGSYRYVRDGFFARIFSFIMYRLIFMPWSFVYLKIKYGFSIKNRKVIKQAKDGFFLYGNHTTSDADPYVPTMVAFPKDVHVVVAPANVYIPVIGKIVRYIGALPLPDDMEATHNFISAIEKRCEQKKAICIYPEAHIWPYCTFIRNFKDQSFRYPIKYDKPVFCFTNVYTGRKRRTPRMTTYVDGPFYADKSLPVAAARKKLRDEVFAAMTERSKLSDYDGIVYVKATENGENPDGENKADNK